MVGEGLVKGLLGKSVGNTFLHLTNQLTKLTSKFLSSQNNVHFRNSIKMKNTSDDDDTVSSCGEEAYVKAAMETCGIPPLDSEFHSAENDDEGEGGPWRIAEKKKTAQKKRKNRLSSTKSLDCTMEEVQDEKRLRKGSEYANDTERVKATRGFLAPKQLSKQQPNMIFVVKGLEGKKVCLLSPVKIVQQLHKEVGELEKVSKEKTHLKIICKNEKQAKKLIEMQNLAGIPVKVEAYEPFTESRGVIHEVDKAITDEELMELLRDKGVSRVKRFKKRIKGELVPTPSVMLVFKDKIKPSSVSFLWENYKVEEYVAPVTRCFKCQRFGHIQKYCDPASEVRCVRCGENHTFEECPTKNSPKCFRCKQAHSAAFQGCPYYKEAKEIQSLKLLKQVSYAQATKHYREQESTAIGNTRQDQIGKDSHTGDGQAGQTQSIQETQGKINKKRESKQTAQENKITATGTQTETSEINMDTNTTKEIITESVVQAPVSPFEVNIEFLSFIAYVVNNLDKVKNPVNRTRMIIEGAKRYLGISNVSPEMIQNRLQDIQFFPDIGLSHGSHS